MLKRWVVVFAVAAAPLLAQGQRTLLIAGGVYEDRPALALRTSFIGLGGVTVKLYRDGGDQTPSADDVMLATTKTKGDGMFVFRLDRIGDYWVAVDSRTIRNDAWAEQTFGPAGALCVRPDGTTVSIQSEGPCFAGRTINSDDASSLTGAVITCDRGWTAFTEHRYEEARGYQERAAEMAEKQPAVLPEVLYDLAVIRLAAGDKEKAQSALDRALQLNPKLKQQADKDKDLAGLK